MAKKVYILKINEATRKQLEMKQDKMAKVIKRITGKNQKPPFTKIVSLSLRSPIYLDDSELLKLPKKKYKIWIKKHR